MQREPSNSPFAVPLGNPCKPAVAVQQRAVAAAAVVAAVAVAVVVAAAAEPVLSRSSSGPWVPLGFATAHLSSEGQDREKQRRFVVRSGEQIMVAGVAAAQVNFGEKGAEGGSGVDVLLRLPPPLP